MKVDYVHKDSLTATDYVELNKNNELLISYNQALLKENQELKKKYENAVADYETTMAEKNELKKQLEVKKIIARDWEVECKKNISEVEEKETQQKEFIKWLEDYLKLFDTMDIEEQASYDTIEKILQKYKEILGDDK